MERKITLFHGSQKIIQSPTFGAGNPKNDYGLGFYCTESLELAKEWACTEENSGYANQYLLDTSGLSVMNLSEERYSILNWLAILLQNRTFKIASDLAAEAKEYLLTEFLPIYDSYDLIIGYRADDSYFSFANAFLNSTISLKQLKQAMYLGKLGEQTVLKSQKAFEQLQYVDHVIAEQEIYYPKKTARDKAARTAYRTERGKSRAADAVYMLDILREEWKQDDPRLRRNISE